MRSWWFWLQDLRNDRYTGLGLRFNLAGCQAVDITKAISLMKNMRITGALLADKR